MTFWKLSKYMLICTKSSLYFFKKTTPTLSVCPVVEVLRTYIKIKYAQCSNNLWITQSVVVQSNIGTKLKLRVLYEAWSFASKKKRVHPILQEPGECQRKLQWAQNSKFKVARYFLPCHQRSPTSSVFNSQLWDLASPLKEGFGHHDGQTGRDRICVKFSVSFYRCCPMYIAPSVALFVFLNCRLTNVFS